MSRAEATRLRPPDAGVLVATAVLSGLGIVMVYSTTAPLALHQAVPPLFLKHVIAVVFGVGVATVAAWIPLRVWARAAFPLWGVSVALLVATLAFGVRVNGAERWLAVPGLDLRFQPGEIAKWAALLAVALRLGRTDGDSGRPSAVAPVLLLGGLPAALLLLEPDTGSAVLLVGLVALLLFVAGTPFRTLLVPTLLGVLALSTAILLRPYALARLEAFWHPWQTANAQGFQLVQSFVAFGRGGAFGVGLGNGRQKLFYLPEAHTDFVLSVVAEELGLLGVAVVLGAFLALLLGGARIAARANDRTTLLVAFAMTALLTVPAGLNAAVVMGLVPPKGLALPFLSYGRSSILVSFLSVGVLVGVGRREAAGSAPTVTSAERRRRRWRWR